MNSFPDDGVSSSLVTIVQPDTQDAKTVGIYFFPLIGRPVEEEEEADTEIRAPNIEAPTGSTSSEYDLYVLARKAGRTAVGSTDLAPL
jgi:hypothetical protein